jgi:hypothetical protein
MGNPIRLARNYDTRRGWDNTKPGWHTYSVEFPADQSILHLAKRFNEILDWVYDHIDNCEYHCRWILKAESRKLIIRFRYEKDYFRFALTW